jgi:hypothetical protein
MTRPELAGARAKIERAKKHICDLQRERNTFLGSNPYRTSAEFYPEHTATAYFLDECPPIPVTISLIAGDAIHSLRTALDYLAFALVERNPGDLESAHLYFPICKSREAYESESSGKTKGIPQDIKERIDAFKPYAGGDDRLWGLHRLDIIDKHRLLMTTATIIRDIKFDVDAAFIEGAFPGLLTMPLDFPKQTVKFPAPKTFSPMKEGALLYGVKGNFETDERIDFTFDITIGEIGVFEGNLLVETLSELVDMVESIVLSFS